jgi:glycine cleavage system T protein (aminomethyltransferase)
MTIDILTALGDREHFRNLVFPTPFHERTAALNQQNAWHRWKDYTTADEYFSLELEYFAVRNACSVFDLTPMTKHRITGPDALPFLDRLVTRDVSKIKPGRVAYVVWCDDEGQIIDDGTIFHLRPNEYRLCSQERQLDWLLASALGFDVRIEEETHQVAALAFQGPTTCAVLKRMGLTGVEQLKPFDLRDYSFADTKLMVSRTGFTGDLGYELWIDPAHALLLWDRLFEAGRDYGIMAIGTLALDMVRIEAGFVQAGVDFLPVDQAVRPGRSRSPLELGLGWLVDFKKPHFNGRRALAAEQARGPRYNFVKLEIDGNKPAKDAFIYNARGKVIGTVTSGMWSPSAKSNIALASLDAPWGKPDDEMYAEIYYQRELKWKRVRVSCRVHEGPFFDPPRRRATPAPDF